MTTSLNIRARCTLCGTVKYSATVELEPGKSTRVRGVSADACQKMLGMRRCGGLGVVVEIEAPVVAPGRDDARPTATQGAFL